jgi:hypothetical protein
MVVLVHHVLNRSQVPVVLQFPNWDGEDKMITRTAEPGVLLPCGDWVTESRHRTVSVSTGKGLLHFWDEDWQVLSMWHTLHAQPCTCTGTVLCDACYAKQRMPFRIRGMPDQFFTATDRGRKATWKISLEVSPDGDVHIRWPKDDPEYFNEAPGPTKNPDAAIHTVAANQNNPWQPTGFAKGMCCICMERPVVTVVDPCGHMCLCDNPHCLALIDRDRCCPVCRSFEAPYIKLLRVHMM